MRRLPASLVPVYHLRRRLKWKGLVALEHWGFLIFGVSGFGGDQHCLIKGSVFFLLQITFCPLLVIFCFWEFLVLDIWIEIAWKMHVWLVSQRWPLHNPQCFQTPKAGFWTRDSMSQSKARRAEERGLSFPQIYNENLISFLKSIYTHSFVDSSYQEPFGPSSWCSAQDEAASSIPQSGGFHPPNKLPPRPLFHPLFAATPPAKAAWLVHLGPTRCHSSSKSLCGGPSLVEQIVSRRVPKSTMVNNTGIADNT